MPESTQPYEAGKAQAKAVSSAAGIFGIMFFAGWVAQIVLPHAEDWKTLIPGEILTQTGMTAFVVYIWSLVKDLLVKTGNWPKILG